MAKILKGAISVHLQHHKKWSSFAKKLFKVLRILDKDQSLIVSIKGTNKFVQFSVQRPLGMRIETTSNNYLTGPAALKKSQLSALVNAGWYRILSNPVYIGKIAHKSEVYDGQHSAIIDDLTWQAVQEELLGNSQASRTRTNAAKPSLLAGLVFDDRGKRLRPTHSQKGTRRYRYYVGEELHEAGRETHPQALRWPATELEDAVLNALYGFLKDESKLLVHGSQGNAGEIGRKLRHASDLAERLQARAAPDQIGVLNRIVKKIDVYPDRVEIVVRIAAVLNDAELDTEAITLIEVPVKLKRYGMVMRLIVNAPGSEVAGKPDPKMVALLAKAHRWFEQLRSGKVDGVQSIAAEEHVTASYVTWVIYLAFLAPDLVERIMTGNHPRELNSKRLLRMLPLPMSWDDQRTRLGMSP